MYSSEMFAGLFVFMFVAAAVIGGAIVGICFWLVPWLWAIAKPWLHAITG